MANKPVIAVDVDDVLAATARGFVEYSNKKWGTNLKPDDYDEHWAEIWKTDYEEELRRRDIIVKEKVFTSFSFFDEAKPALEQLAKKYKLGVVTSRSSHVSDDTREWLTLHFGDLFSEMYFAKIWDQENVHTLDKLKMTKADLVKEAGAEYFIDDHPKHCLAAAKEGVKVVLFGDYRWNRDTKLLPNMVRAKNWQEVLDYFDGR